MPDRAMGTVLCHPTFWDAWDAKVVSNPNLWFPLFNHSSGLTYPKSTHFTCNPVESFTDYWSIPPHWQARLSNSWVGQSVLRLPGSRWSQHTRAHTIRLWVWGIVVRLLYWKKTPFSLTDVGLEQPIANWTKDWITVWNSVEGGSPGCSEVIAHDAQTGELLAHIDLLTPKSWKPRCSRQLAFSSSSSLQLAFFCSSNTP